MPSILDRSSLPSLRTRCTSMRQAMVPLRLVLASLLLFTLVFLSVTREPPKWPLPMVSGAALTMAGLYWAFFRYFAGGSLGTKLARIAESDGRDREIREETFR